MVRHLAAFLEARGIECAITDAAEGRPNLVARVAGPEPGPHLLLCGHTDTVPPNAGVGAPEIETCEAGGVLNGRGSVDMKGAVAAMAATLVRLRARLARGTVSLAAVADEEMRSLGTEALIRSGFRADAAIVGEPTECRVAIGHKGLEWLNVDFEGKTTHGGTPKAGINAIAAAARFAELVATELVPALEARTDPVLGPPMINLGTIHGGDQPSTVAGHCRIQLDRRWVTTETVEQVFEDLERLLARVREAFSGLRTSISRLPDGHGNHGARAGHDRPGPRDREGRRAGARRARPERAAHGIPRVDRRVADRTRRRDPTDRVGAGRPGLRTFTPASTSRSPTSRWRSISTPRRPCTSRAGDEAQGPAHLHAAGRPDSDGGGLHVDRARRQLHADRARRPRGDRPGLLPPGAGHAGRTGRRPAGVSPGPRRGRRHRLLHLHPRRGVRRPERDGHGHRQHRAAGRAHARPPCAHRAGAHARLRDRRRVGRDRRGDAGVPARAAAALAVDGLRLASGRRHRARRRERRVRRRPSPTPSPWASRRALWACRSSRASCFGSSAGPSSRRRPSRG